MSFEIVFLLRKPPFLNCWILIFFKSVAVFMVNFFFVVTRHIGNSICQHIKRHAIESNHLLFSSVNPFYCSRNLSQLNIELFEHTDCYKYKSVHVDDRTSYRSSILLDNKKTQLFIRYRSVTIYNQYRLYKNIWKYIRGG